METIYLDYNATTPLDRGVAEAMMPFLTETYGNPSSSHHVGRKARALMDDARDRLAGVFRCKPSELVFTSGGTEADNLAILGCARVLGEQGRHLISSPTEHHAVLHTLEHLAKEEGYELDLLPVDKAGRIDPDDLKAKLRPDTILVSVMSANNETGTVQPVDQLGGICRDRGVVFHTDAVQSFGKRPFESISQFRADLVTLCPHKFHGPKGIGLLYIRSPLQPQRILFGGGHENDRRSGTENLAGIIGLVESTCRFVPTPVFSTDHLIPKIRCLTALLKAIEGFEVAGSEEDRLPNTLAFTVTGCDSASLLAALDIEGVCASSGSACSAGALTPSHVIQAMGISADRATCFVRLSLGRETTEEEIARVGEMLPGLIDRIRKAAG